MNAATVSRVLSLIPDRIARTQMGGLFDPANSAACAHPDRIVHLVQFLNWLGPLQPLTKEDLRLFGLVNPYGRPASEAPVEDEADALDAELDAEVDAEIALAAPLSAVAAEVQQEPALT